MTFQPASNKAIWKGIVSSDWLTPANWSTGKVPDENTDVIISDQVPFNPILTVPAKVRSLLVMNNRTVTLKDTWAKEARKG